jgi:serine protease
MEASAQELAPVDAIDPNEMLQLHETASNPDDPQLTEQYAPQQTNAVDAWSAELGSEDVSIAIIDTGADYEHETLESRYGENVGRDFAAGDGDPIPSGSSEKHGTHTSGIAGATTDSGQGVAGMANCQLYSVRALGNGGGSTSDIADAIQWAADQGVDIINMSLGGGGSTEVMKNAVSYAWNEGVLICASAGNSGREGVSYPSAYNEVISVSAVDENEQLADFSQYGEKVELTGPGVNVLSTVPGDDYERLSGTSMSCPAVAGVAALGKSANTDLSNNELRAALKETARDIGLSEKAQGSGLVDAMALVEQVSGGNEEPEEPEEPENPEDPEEPEEPEEPEDPTCGGATEGGSATGQIGYYSPSETYSYSTRTNSPCQIEVSLVGPADADIDLFVTLDGRTPTPDDYDASSETADANEQIILDDIDASTELGIRVEGIRGGGEFEISVEEVGA